MYDKYVLFLFYFQIHTDSDEGEGNIKYTISGEGAGSIFIIDELTGDIHATERLDREEKAFYTLRAQARDRLSNDPLEPESEFVIKVQDINDSEPKFLEGPYIGSVAELSPIGKEAQVCAQVCAQGWFIAASSSDVPEVEILDWINSYITVIATIHWLGSVNILFFLLKSWWASKCQKQL